MRQLLRNLFVYHDTCNVYVLRSGSDAILIDFGDGAVLDQLAAIGIERVTHILMTHHHRDQAQGLPRAVAAGIPILVPEAERDLFAEVDAHWQARAVTNNYNLRQDRFSLLESVPVTATLLDYATYHFGDYALTVIPTPSHTVGSITLLVEHDGERLAFTGDLICAPGKVWSMAATQWGYNSADGVPAGIASLLDLKERQPSLLLPAHGDPMEDPDTAIDLLVARFWQLLELRGEHVRLFELRAEPYRHVTPHVLKSRVCLANSYVVLSASGKALMIDFGYDFETGLAAGSDRAARRPWLYTINTLKRQFNISHIDAVIPTHYHDDHVAGCNLLRRVEGTEVWAAANFADILEHPADYDLPCLWYDPIRMDRVLPLDTAFEWEEYTFRLYALPGHTKYAVAICFEADGHVVLATGDQYQSALGTQLNYVYGGGFEAADYVKSADLYTRLCPAVILTGHWNPQWTTPEYFEQIRAIGAELERLHRDLLPNHLDLGTGGFLAHLAPYQTTARRGDSIDIRAEVRSPHPFPVEAALHLVVPPGWQVAGATFRGAALTFDAQQRVTVCLEGTESYSVVFRVTPTDTPVRRARVALDLTVHGQAFGQQAEALVTLI
ncbi:MAG: MBL fold metallo-hydrolase [Chloroflexi bacterium]|uniref:MBL fold metallo-hydrolase n=1 Tax=Candidatus Flexifilum breve TaxID=3140694 RepID=UPI0031356FAF|nr:MBL fold metallo-hydrolase [Chloroflexota bacterium]